MNHRRLYRSSDDRILAGVCGGVAEYFDVDPVIIRIVWFLSVFFTGSLTFWAYLVMIFVVPLEPSDWQASPPWAPGGAPTWYSAQPPSASGTGSAPFAAGTSTDSTGSGSGSEPAGPSTGPDTAPVTAGAPGGGWPNDWRWQRRQERWQRRAERRATRQDRAPGLIFGLLLILVGGLLVWHQIDPRIDLGAAWPVAVIILGAILVASSLRPRGKS
jgi:phage shock protein PspC (stress-responsive transcriptional regulator)